MQTKKTEKQLHRISEVLLPSPEDTHPTLPPDEVMFWAMAYNIKFRKA